MTGPAAAAEETPVLVGLYMTVEAVLAWLLERALLLVWIYTVGAILLALGNVLTYDKYFIHIHWGGPFFRLERDVHKWLVEQIFIQEYAIGWWWHQTARIQGWLAHETWGWAKDLYHWGGWVVDVFVPAHVQGAVKPVSTKADTAAKVAHATALSQARTARTVVIPHAGDLDWLHRHRQALERAAALAGAAALAPGLTLPRLWHGIDDLRKWRPTVNRRLHKLEIATGAAAFAALMANVLGLPNWRCLTRGNVGRISRVLCGLSARAFEDILGLLVDLFLLTNVCQAITLVSDGLAFIEPEITAFITAAETMACYGDDEHLPPGPDVFLSLPPVTGLVLPIAA